MSPILRHYHRASAYRRVSELLIRKVYTSECWLTYQEGALR